MIAIILIMIVGAAAIIIAVANNYNKAITKFQNQVDDLKKQFNSTEQSYNEFKSVYNKLSVTYDTANNLYMRSYKDIMETYHRLIELLKEYNNMEIELQSIKEKENELINFRNEVIEEIKNNPNYDADTKYHLIKQILNSGSYNQPIPTIFGIEEEINKE